MSLALAYVTGILSLLFAASLLDQYLTRRQPYHILWAAALVLFSTAMLLWFLRETFGLNQWVFRLWYLTGAMLVPAYLGTGFLYLMAPRHVVKPILGALLVLTFATLILVLTADFRTPEGCLAGLKGLECLLPPHSLTQKGFSPPWIRILGVILNLYGGLAVLAGVVWSIRPLMRAEASPGEAGTVEATGSMTAALVRGYRNTVLVGNLLWQNRHFWRKDIHVQRAASNIIVTLGACPTILEEKPLPGPRESCGDLMRPSWPGGFPSAVRRRF